MKTWKLVFLVAIAAIFGSGTAIALGGGTSDIIGRLLVHDGTRGTCAVATGDGDFCAKDAIEAEGAVDIGTTLTVAGASTLTGAVTLGSTLVALNPVETKTAAYTVDCSTDSGMIILDATDDAVITLPAVAAANKGCTVTLINTAADDTSRVAFSPQAADAIYGTVAAVSASGTDNESWSNTLSGSNNGDYTTLVSDGSTGWYIVGGVGVWLSGIVF